MKTPNLKNKNKTLEIASRNTAMQIRRRRMSEFTVGRFMVNFFMAILLMAVWQPATLPTAN